tara:strand:- start:28785 stop:29366 length:582 start_codon:yes stop_codon:yes gene_type:complete
MLKKILLIIAGTFNSVFSIPTGANVFSQTQTQTQTETQLENENFNNLNNNQLLTAGAVVAYGLMNQYQPVSYGQENYQDTAGNCYASQGGNPSHCEKLNESECINLQSDVNNCLDGILLSGYGITDEQSNSCQTDHNPNECFWRENDANYGSATTSANYDNANDAYYTSSASKPEHHIVTLGAIYGVTHLLAY